MSIATGSRTTTGDAKTSPSANSSSSGDTSALRKKAPTTLADRFSIERRFTFDADAPTTNDDGDDRGAWAIRRHLLEVAVLLGLMHDLSPLGIEILTDLVDAAAEIDALTGMADGEGETLYPLVAADLRVWTARDGQS